MTLRSTMPPGRSLARIFHTLRSRGRESAHSSAPLRSAPTHVGGYGLSARQGECEKSRLAMKAWADCWMDEWLAMFGAEDQMNQDF